MSVTTAQSITETEVEKAEDLLIEDPNLSGDFKTRTLKWARQDNKEKPATVPAWVAWLISAFSWMAQTTRDLLLVILALLAAVLVVFIVRLLRGKSLPTRTPGFVAPTHVRDLDIRPEALPADIGAAVRALWDSGDHRAALALLYRGLLSRLVHNFSVPIRDSSTEGDCVMLAREHLPEDRVGYAVRIVKVWQQCVYGGLDPTQQAVHLLCDEFASTLDMQAAASPT